jgi:hypothetical protein
VWCDGQVNQGQHSRDHAAGGEATHETQARVVEFGEPPGAGGNVRRAYQFSPSERWGCPPLVFVKLLRGWIPVEFLVLEHGVENVAAASGEADQGRVVFFLRGAPFVVVGATGGVVEGVEGAQEQAALEFLVARAGPGAHHGSMSPAFG